MRAAGVVLAQLEAYKTKNIGFLGGTQLGERGTMSVSSTLRGGKPKCNFTGDWRKQ